MNELLKNSIKWSISIAVITFVLAAIFSIVTNGILSEMTWTYGLLVVLVIVLIGIFFDMIGIAAAAAVETPFHSMASRKVYGAKHSVRLVRSADRVASFCNDVVGDTTGVISGTASALVIIQFAQAAGLGQKSPAEYAINVGLTSLIAAMTVGGKALGKSFAITYAKDIILYVGKVLQFLEDKLRIVIIKDTRKKTQQKNKKRK